MPKRAKELTAVEVKRLVAPGWHAVGTVPGLGLKAAPTGTRSWVLRVVVGTKRREIGLGAYPAVTLADAHAKARVIRAEVEQGIDPLEKRRDARSALIAAQTVGMTFDQCSAAYIRAHRDGWKNSKHAQQWENTLATYAGPVIGAMLVRHVETPHILAVLEPIWRDRTETATRLRARLELVIDWATARGERTGLNPARWRGHLDKLLPKPSKVADRGHHAALPWRISPASGSNPKDTHMNNRPQGSVWAKPCPMPAITPFIWRMAAASAAALPVLLPACTVLVRAAS